MPDYYSHAFEIIKRFDQLPDDAVVQTKVTALMTGLSEKTVRKHYPRVPVSPGRYGQRVGDIRSRVRNGSPRTAV
jgi:hypothetical protein